MDQVTSIEKKFEPVFVGTSSPDSNSIDENAVPLSKSSPIMKNISKSPRSDVNSPDLDMSGLLALSSAAASSSYHPVKPSHTKRNYYAGDLAVSDSMNHHGSLSELTSNQDLYMTYSPAGMPSQKSHSSPIPESSNYAGTAESIVENGTPDASNIMANSSAANIHSSHSKIVSSNSPPTPAAKSLSMLESQNFDGSAIDPNQPSTCGNSGSFTRPKPILSWWMNDEMIREKIVGIKLAKHDSNNSLTEDGDDMLEYQMTGLVPVKAGNYLSLSFKVDSGESDESVQVKSSPSSLMLGQTRPEQLKMQESRPADDDNASSNQSSMNNSPTKKMTSSVLQNSVDYQVCVGAFPVQATGIKVHRVSDCIRSISMKITCPKWEDCGWFSRNVPVSLLKVNENKIVLASCQIGELEFTDSQIGLPSGGFIGYSPPQHALMFPKSQQNSQQGSPTLAFAHHLGVFAQPSSQFQQMVMGDLTDQGSNSANSTPVLKHKHILNDMNSSKRRYEPYSKPRNSGNSNGSIGGQYSPPLSSGQNQNNRNGAQKFAPNMNPAGYQEEDRHQEIVESIKKMKDKVRSSNQATPPATPAPSEEPLVFVTPFVDMTMNWTPEERSEGRRIVKFNVDSRMDGVLSVKCEPVSLNSHFSRNEGHILVSCLYWADVGQYYISSVDLVYLLERIINLTLSSEVKNRLRRNLEKFQPITLSKSPKQGMPQYQMFTRIMAFGEPRPRNIEKDIKIFPWCNAPGALIKCFEKYGEDAKIVKKNRSAQIGRKPQPAMEYSQNSYVGPVPRTNVLQGYQHTPPGLFKQENIVPNEQASPYMNMDRYRVQRGPGIKPNYHQYYSNPSPFDFAGRNLPETQ